MTNQHSEIRNQKSIGYIVGGGLKESFRVRLTIPAQEVQEGAFVITETGEWQFYGLITDLQLGAIDPRFADVQSSERLPDNIAKLLQDKTLYTDLEMLPALMLNRGPDPETDPQGAAAFDPESVHAISVKTVPAHHSPVRLAGPGDIADIFGKVGEKGNFIIGHTREQGHPVVIDLEKFVKRSSGVFGATGTGKSFLTRLILAGLIHYDAASALILDMHNEYGYDDLDEDRNKVIGLKTKFPTKVQVVVLGSGSQIRGEAPDFNLEIAMSDIQAQDIELLTRELNLKETTPTTLDALVTTTPKGENWFEFFKDMKIGAVVENDDGKKAPAPDSVAYWANQNGVNVMAAEGLHSKLRRVFSRDYIVAEPAADTITEIVKALQAGRHIVLSFGKHETDLDYLLVSNLLTRRIRQVWEKTTNEYRTSGKGEPRPLVIVVEEAHKLLNREMAAQTTFSTIARELRKYYVTLMIIDQRPSQIYDEVMSQLGTRISGWLGDEDDIRAVLSGLAGREALRGMLARLQPKEEVLLLGWGVPMPLPIRSRRYDETFWKELLGKKGKKQSADEIGKELGY